MGAQEQRSSLPWLRIYAIISLFQPTKPERGIPLINPDRLVNTFLDLVRIDSPSGQEAVIGRDLQVRLTTLGLASEIDEHGNVIGRLEGDGDQWLLLSAHTVSYTHLDVYKRQH